MHIEGEPPPAGFEPNRSSTEGMHVSPDEKHPGPHEEAETQTQRVNRLRGAALERDDALSAQVPTRALGRPRNSDATLDLSPSAPLEGERTLERGAVGRRSMSREHDLDRHVEQRPQSFDDLLAGHASH